MRGYVHTRPQRSAQKKLAPRKSPLPSFGYVHRSRSILLDPVNPILHPSHYVQHKSSPPNVNPQTTRKNKESEPPGAMTTEDRSWWSSPWLRMMSSPLRRCIMTSRSLPTDFLIRLAPFRLPTPRLAREAQSLLPDGLEHPKFRNRKAGFGHYILCYKKAVEELYDRKSYKRISPTLSMHALLAQHIGHLLRVRVLQELELLTNRLHARPQGAEDTIVLRRLTRAEFTSMREKRMVPYEGAVAIIVVPPLNRDPVTKTRPKPSSTTVFSEESAEANGLHKSPSAPLPLSSLYPVDNSEPFGVDVPDLPSSIVPFYNGVSLFPSRSQRAALYASLTHLLFVERRARYRQVGRPGPSAAPQALKDDWARGDNKASYAFLLCSDGNTTKRADTAAVAIALWRVRMWESGGWETGGGGWVLRPANE